MVAPWLEPQLSAWGIAGPVEFGKQECSGGARRQATGEEKSRPGLMITKQRRQHKWMCSEWFPSQTLETPKTRTAQAARCCLSVQQKKI